MIKEQFIKAQISKSHIHKQTSSFLRRLVFSTVEREACRHYGNDQAVRCLQVSAAIQSLLSRFNIRSQLYLGAVCVPGIYEDLTACSWAGFWGEDHHVWLQTEFYELADLNISKLHMHPRSARTDGVPMPAIWWDDVGAWPPVIRYLPEAPVGKITLPTVDDELDIKRFLVMVNDALDSRLRDEQVHEICFPPVLDNAVSMDDLTSKAHPWLAAAITYQEEGISLPDWIQNREAVLYRS